MLSLRENVPIKKKKLQFRVVSLRKANTNKCKNKTCALLVKLKITLSLRNEKKKNQVHLNHFIALEAADSPASCFMADEKKSKYGADVEETASTLGHTLAFVK